MGDVCDDGWTGLVGGLVAFWGEVLAGLLSSWSLVLGASVGVYGTFLHIFLPCFFLLGSWVLVH